jgi:hypothetical protein
MEFELTDDSTTYKKNKKVCKLLSQKLFIAAVILWLLDYDSFFVGFQGSKFWNNDTTSQIFINCLYYLPAYQLAWIRQTQKL